jgi:hypothetical protein
VRPYSWNAACHAASRSARRASVSYSARSSARQRASSSGRFCRRRCSSCWRTATRCCSMLNSASSRRLRSVSVGGGGSTLDSAATSDDTTSDCAGSCPSSVGVGVRATACTACAKSTRTRTSWRLWHAGSSSARRSNGNRMRALASLLTAPRPLFALRSFLCKLPMFGASLAPGIFRIIPIVQLEFANA